MQETSSFLQVQFDNIYLHAKPNRAVRNFDSSSQRKKRRKTLQYAKYVPSMSLSFKNNYIFNCFRIFFSLLNLLHASVALI